MTINYLEKKNHTFVLFSFGMALSMLIGCAGPNAMYLARIENNTPPPPPDLAKLEKEERSEEEALQLYRKHAIVAYRLGSESNWGFSPPDAWSFTIGESSTGYTLESMSTYVNESYSSGKRVGGQVVFVAGHLAFASVQALYILNIFGVLDMALFMFPAAGIGAGGLAMVESSDNDIYAETINYNVRLAKALKLKLDAPGKSVPIYDPLRPEAIAREQEFEDRFVNVEHARFLEMIFPVGGIGCYYAESYVWGSIALAMSGAGTGAFIWGVTRDDVNVPAVLGGLLGYLVGRLVGVLDAPNAAVNLNEDLRKELYLPEKPTDYVQ